MSKKLILVTGGTGYIGSHTTVELLNSGYDVLIVDNLSNSNIDFLDRIKKITGTRPRFEEFDLCDQKKTEELFSSNDIEAVINFAAFKAVNESVLEPLKYYRNNLFSLINVLLGMEKGGCKKIVHSSSCTVYGNADSLPVDESAPTKKAESPYGNTKQMAEDILSDTAKAKAIRAIALRYFNPIGAHESALIGELPNGTPVNLVPYITQTAIGIRQELSVFGNKHKTRDGYCIRDYIHVVDLAKAHVAALSRLDRTEDKYDVFNLGTGRGVSVKEMIDAFEKVSGQKLKYKVVEDRAGDIDEIYADSGKANRLLGWKAERSLEESLLSAWEWEKGLRGKS